MGDKTPPNIRLLRIVEILSKHGKPISPTELNAELDLPKQSIHRLCNTLIEAGFLEKAERKKNEDRRVEGDQYPKSVCGIVHRQRTPLSLPGRSLAA